MNNKIAIAWTDLTYKVKPFLKEEKTILNRIYGSIDFGTINALMGPSGAGKTSLLKCINGQIKSGIGSETRIFLNSNIKIRSCIIGQHERERLIMGLTVKQNMIYSSKLKNSCEKSDINHEMIVNEILSELMITEVEDTIVGDCSGGQQRRISIAIEMTQFNKPNLLCIDEPTTGLDSNAAETVMSCLKDLSQKHKIAVITSIHQPSEDILMMFNKLYVLAKGGLCVYSGPPQQLPQHLSSCQITINEYEVPIEVLVKIASNDRIDERIEKLVEKTSERRQSIVKNCMKDTKHFPNGIEIKSKSFKFIDFWNVLMRTMIQNYVSQWRLNLFQIITYILWAILTAILFNEDVGKPDGCFTFITDPNTSCTKSLDDDEVLDQNIKFIFFTTCLVQLIQLCVTIVTYVSDVKIFFSEHQNNWYSSGAYFLAINIVEALPTIVYSIIYSFIAYYLSGQFFEYHRVYLYALIMILAMICVQSVGILIGTLFSQYEQIALITGLGIMVNFVMFGNFYIIITDLPQIFQYYSIISFAKYCFNSALIIIYGLGRCSPEMFSLIFYKFDVNDDQLIPNIQILAIYILILRLFAYIILYIKANNFYIPRKPTEVKDLKFHKSIESIKQISIDFKTIKDEFNDNNNIDYEETTDENMKLKNMCSIAWLDLSLTFPKKLFSAEKRILKSINGFVDFGSLTALMGPSGAGKTSLLKCLNNMFRNQLSDETKIYLNKSVKIKSCFITQHEREHLMNGLTTKQAIIYASKLKNTDTIVDHQKNAENLMKDLLIRSCADTSVEKCSGGEQKRIVIAMELTSYIKPNLLCIDEPTSGLDSNAAEVVIRCLKDLSQKHNISVIASIHQPNNEIFIMFNKVYVLAKGGVCVYFGEPKKLDKHLSECKVECKAFQVPIEVLLKHCCEGIEGKHVIDLSNKTSEQRQTIVDKCDDECLLFPDGIQFRSKRFNAIDLWTLTLRTITYTYQYFWKLLLLQFILYMISGYALRVLFDPRIGVPTGCVNFEEDFNNTCNKTPEKLEEESLIQANIKYNFFVFVLIMFYQLVATTMTFTHDVRIFSNEHRNCWYSTGAYYWSKSLVELIPSLIIVGFYVFVVDIFEGNKIFYGYLCFLTIGVLNIQSVGNITGIVFNENPKIAIFVSVGIFTVSSLFCNFLIPIKELHYVFKELSNLSALKLVFECIMILFYGFELCTKDEFSLVLVAFDIEDITFYRNTRILIYQFIFLRCLTLIALLLKVNPFENTKKAEETKELARKALKPSNAYIPGLNSHNNYKIRI